VRNPFTTGRVAVTGATVVIVLAAAGAAFAFFTSTGSGTGSASVGTTEEGDWSKTGVTVSGTLYPGGPPITFTYTFKNHGSGDEAITNASASVLADGSGYVEHNGVPKTGCLQTWFFTPSVITPLPTASVPPNGTTTVQVRVQMKDSGTNQDPCQGATPDVTLNIFG